MSNVWKPKHYEKIAANEVENANVYQIIISTINFERCNLLLMTSLFRNLIDKC